MALDKLVDSAQLNADLASVANAIRTKGGTSAPLAFPQGFVDAVDAIPAGGASVLEKLKEIVLEEPVRSVRVEITEGLQGYDFYVLHCLGHFDANGSDWLYWAVNDDSVPGSTYVRKKDAIDCFVAAAKIENGKFQPIGPHSTNPTMFVALSQDAKIVTPLAFFFVHGYAVDIAAGTSFTLWGLKYEDL